MWCLSDLQILIFLVKKIVASLLPLLHIIAHSYTHTRTHARLPSPPPSSSPPFLPLFPPHSPKKASNATAGIPYNPPKINLFVMKFGVTPPSYVLKWVRGKTSRQRIEESEAGERWRRRGRREREEEGGEDIFGYSSLLSLPPLPSSPLSSISLCCSPAILSSSFCRCVLFSPLSPLSDTGEIPWHCNHQQFRKRRCSRQEY